MFYPYTQPDLPSQWCQHAGQERATRGKKGATWGQEGPRKAGGHVGARRGPREERGGMKGPRGDKKGATRGNGGGELRGPRGAGRKGTEGAGQEGAMTGPGRGKAEWVVRVWDRL